MKTVFSLLFFIVIQLSTYVHCQNLLNGPECVVFDSLHNRYLVSNWNNGNIIAINSAGNQSYFKQRSGHASGNCISGNTFYVSTGNTILGLNLDNPNDTVMYLPISGTSEIDGMTVDGDNNLYLVAKSVAKIYKVNLLTQIYSVFVSSGISSRPQDVIYDANRKRLLVCSWYNNSPIQAVDLNDSTVSNLVFTPSGNCDGLALDENGNYYFSSWITGSVHSYDTTFTNPPLLFSSGHNGPSNICFNKRDKVIAVPSFNSNLVNLIPIIPSSVKESNIGPDHFQLLHNYPNPFNPDTKIQYSIPQSSKIKVKIFDLLGNEIETLVNQEKIAGTYEITWNANNLPSGIYFCRLESGNYTSAINMLLIK